MRVQRLRDREDEKRQHKRCDDGGDVETPVPGKGVLDNVASSNGRNVPTRDQRKGIDPHIEPSLMFKEQVRHRRASQTERHSPEESIQCAESDQFPVCAGSARGSGSCDCDGYAYYIDGTPAVDVGDWVPEER